MKTHVLERDEAPYKWVAARDASLRNSVNQGRYNSTQQGRAYGAMAALDHCFSSTGLFINYRKKFIAIKIEHGQAIRKKELKLLEDAWDIEPMLIVTKEKTDQGFVYRFYFL